MDVINPWNGKVQSIVQEKIKASGHRRRGSTIAAALGDDAPQPQGDDDGTRRIHRNTHAGVAIPRTAAAGLAPRGSNGRASDPGMGVVRRDDARPIGFLERGVGPVA